MMSLEQVICECTRKAEANRELAKYNKSHVDRANDLKNAEECEQLAAWLRELVERRKAPEIVRCKDCKHRFTHNCVANVWVSVFGYTVNDDFYCGMAERRTNADD